MDRLPVDSSNLAAVGYDPETRTLEIEFRNGRVYRYFDVPSDVYEELMAADTLGGYFNRNIRNRYPFEQIL